jgi:hypothetical protein
VSRLVLVLAAVGLWADAVQAQGPSRLLSEVIIGLGASALVPGGSSAPTETGVGLIGGVSLGLGARSFLDLEGHAQVMGGSSVVTPSCPPGELSLCEASTLVPPALFGIDVRLGVAVTSRARLSLGPAIGWAPGVDNGSRVSAGVAAGVRFSPFSRNGRGLGVDLRAARYFSSLGEVSWRLMAAVGLGL